MGTFTFILIGVFFLATVVYLAKRSKDRRDEEMILKQIAEDGERVQATLPPLQPGALFTAAVTPFPENNTIRFAIRLSPEARDIIARQNLSSLHILDFPNPNYEKEKREQARLKESRKLEDKIAASYEPPKNIEITIEYFCRPNGITRSFLSAGDAKAWTEQLRQGVKKLQDILEANENPAEASTFTVMRKS